MPAPDLLSPASSHWVVQPTPLADALETLERASEAIPMNVNPAMASMYAVNPLPRQGIATLFATHPPIDERIRRLRALDRGRDADRVMAFAA